MQSCQSGKRLCGGLIVRELRARGFGFGDCLRTELFLEQCAQAIVSIPLHTCPAKMGALLDSTNASEEPRCLIRAATESKVRAVCSSGVRAANS